jgi:hypothetical protein
VAANLDDGLRAHQQFIVRRVHDKTHDAVTEVIIALELLDRRGFNFDMMRMHRLPRGGTRPQVRELARARHRVRVRIACFVHDAISDGIRH